MPYSVVKHWTGKEPIKVRWVDTLKICGIHRNRLVAKDFRPGSKIDGFTNISATPMISMVATAQWDWAAWSGHEGHERGSRIVMMHTDNAPCKEEKYVVMHAHWKDAYAKVLRKHQFERGIARPCSFYSRVKRTRITIHGDDFMSGRPKHKLKWLEEVLDKHFESKHTVMGACSDLAKSMVTLNWTLLWQDKRIAFIQDNRHCESCRNTESAACEDCGHAICQRESESADGETTRECSWESMRALDSQREKASMHDVLDADKTSLYRSEAARLNDWAVDRPDIQYAVRVCSKYMSSPGVNDRQRLKCKKREGMSRHGDHDRVADTTKQTHCAKRQ